MDTKLVNFLSSVFGACMFVAVFAGAVTTVIYLVGFVAGGAFGEAAAKLGADIMMKAIPLSAFGSLVGMLGFYIQGTHELTMAKKSSKEET